MDNFFEEIFSLLRSNSHTFQQGEGCENFFLGGGGGLSGLSAPFAGVSRERTLLLIDESEKEESLRYFQVGLGSESCVLLDAFRLHLMINVKKEKMMKLLEEVRRLVVCAMINRKVLVVRLQKVAMNFLNFNDESILPEGQEKDPWPPYGAMSYLPSIWLLEGGKSLREDPVWAKQMFRRGDFDGETKPPCHKDFRIIFTTTIPYDSLDDRLFSSINPCLPCPKEEYFNIITIPSR